MAGARGTYVPPSTYQLAFHCPHCGTFAQQSWHTLHAEYGTSPPHGADEDRFQGAIDPDAHAAPYLSYSNHKFQGGYWLHNTWISECRHCEGVAIWVGDRLMWPQSSEAPPPNPDLPDDVRADYKEAGTILALSPRGAAALLRLAIQKLCEHLGGKGKNLNDDIAALVKNGLPPRVQQMLDAVRVIGNNAVHPGRIDLRDDRSTAGGLFGLVNLIAEVLISQPKHVSEMYAKLPEDGLKAIERRDTPPGDHG